ncbi:hypothetical protein [Pseudomonas nitroreducens]|uniref:hypothetical protein n=1 Tax=Pseudomonas nitroreducens TaxID=46680 RepID=UPI002D7E571C|nr:hypothetical protein [Pseudomonas nitroreducens]
MPQLALMIGGVPIVLHAGATAEQHSSLGGPEIVRLSNGVGVPMTHWSRRAISVNASGWMPPGLAGLDYSRPLELRSTKPECIVSAGRQFLMTSAPRPDFAPWGQALVGKEWVDSPITVDGFGVEVGVVVGATLYRIGWYPVFNVSGRRPQEEGNSSDNTHSWRFDCEEV